MEASSVKFRLSKHAHLVTERRNISEVWIDQVFTNPDSKEIDPNDPTVTRLYGQISDYGNRVLRLSVNFNKNPPMIVSAHFDRGKKGK